MSAPQYTPTPIWHDTITEVDDSIPPDAENWNPCVQGLADNVAWLKQYGAATLMALNWTPEFAFTGGVVQNDMAWDPLQSRWIMVYTDGGGLVHLVTTRGADGGEAAAWTEIGEGGFGLTGGATPSIYVCASSDASTPGKYWTPLVDAIGGGVNNHFQLWHWTGTAWTRTTPGDFVFTASGQFYGCGVCVLAGHVIAAVSGTDTGDSAIFGSADGFTTWSTQLMPPATLGSGLIFLKSNQGMPFAPATPQAVCVQGGGATGVYDVYQSIDGHTWTHSTSLAALAPSGGTISGLAWTRDAIGPCWLIAVETATAHVEYFRSPDGITWTAQAGGIVQQLVPSDLAASGFTMVQPLAHDFGATSSAMTFSVDGGLTWYSGPAGFSSDVTTVGIRPRVHAGPLGLAMHNGKLARFSFCSGLPSSSL